MEPINERIQELIAELGESNNRFAQRIDTSSAVISHIVTGRNRPNLELIQKILRVFPNLQVNWLVMGNDNMYYHPELPLTADPAEEKAAKAQETPGNEQASTGNLEQEAPDNPQTPHPSSQELNNAEEVENLPGMMSNLIGSQRMMLKSMEQQMLMQERFLDWMGRRTKG